MNEDRRRILAMLADGKLSVDEAERLMTALGAEASGTVESASPARPAGPRKYLCVVVDALGDGTSKPTNVNVRVPLQVLRAGVRLTSLLPSEARAKVDRALSENGIDFDLSRMKPENVDELIEALSGTTVDIGAGDEGARVKVFCE